MSVNRQPFLGAARVPADGDNCAIATRRLDAGTVLVDGERELRLSHTLLEGHRFVYAPIEKARPLLSWGLPFGTALRDLAPGETICNARILEVLAQRNVDFALPEAPNFDDAMQRYELDPATFVAGRQVPLAEQPLTFMGYARDGGRGVGTRNHVVVIGLTANEAAMAEALAARLGPLARQHDNFDGVVPVAHTEGGNGGEPPNNIDFVMRALAGFMAHANTAAVIVLDAGAGAYDADALLGFARDHGYALDAVPHAVVKVDDGAVAALEEARGIIEGWLPRITATGRTPQPLRELKVALQCGGSDAFSGVSGNALAADVARRIISNGGSANLAETDELIGAEPYVLANVRDIDTARDFLRRIDVFKERVSWHGASAEGNPSGGNNYRGLYNIALKSIGAARKRDPDVRLDYVIDYGAPMAEPGYYFMDSPGNDLESIAGQVASGCNLIFFITGNGSITNFPFVPTLKFVTTSGRFEMLRDEMDVNAGRYADGEPMDEVGADTFDLSLAIASGQRSKGELAGHAQVSIWRNWAQTSHGAVEAQADRIRADGKPLPATAAPGSSLRFPAWRTERGVATERVGLVMPTSLCSGQVARIVAERLDGQNDASADGGIDRYVALVHTEGCGSANAEGYYLRTLLGHVSHPSVARACMLEHGCEKTHNDAVRAYLAEAGCDPARFGYASVQLDGGHAGVGELIEQWFAQSLAGAAPERVEAGAGDLCLALAADTAPPEDTAAALAALAAGVVAAGGSVVIGEGDPLLEASSVRAGLFDGGQPRVTLDYAEAPVLRGLHVMHMPTADRTERVTGLGASGAHAVLAWAGRAAWPAHPFVPVAQFAAGELAPRRVSDLDLVLEGGDAQPQALEGLLGDVLSGRIVPRRLAAGLAQFQLTRGVLGVSM